AIWSGSARGAAKDFHQLLDLLRLLGGIAAREGVVDAVLHMLAQDILLDTLQRRAHGRDLRENVDAVSLLLHHAGDAANLTFDPVQTRETGSFGVVFGHA